MDYCKNEKLGNTPFAFQGQVLLVKEWPRTGKANGDKKKKKNLLTTQQQSKNEFADLLQLLLQLLLLGLRDSELCFAVTMEISHLKSTQGYFNNEGVDSKSGRNHFTQENSMLDVFSDT